MSSRSEVGSRLFKFAYVSAIAIAMVGWSIALGWAFSIMMMWFL
jgi:hypothetical protein